MYPRLRPPQRGQTKPFGHRCAVRCSPHRTSSPKRERNSLTVMMDFRFNGLDFFMSDILSPFVRLFKLDIHLDFYVPRHPVSVDTLCPSGLPKKAIGLESHIGPWLALCHPLCLQVSGAEWRRQRFVS